MVQETCVGLVGSKCIQVSLGKFIDRSGSFGEVEVRQCTQCGHAVSYPPIPDVAFLYEGRQSQDYQPDSRNSLSRFIKNIAFRFQARRLLRDVGELEGRVLDFGCGSGQFTRVLGEVSANLDVVGCDFFPEPPDELDAGSYLSHAELKAAGKAYDGALALHVLEHDDDTSMLVRSIMAPVKQGGLIVIEVPNVDCVWAKVFGRFWDAWYLPYHRHHFSRSSLQQVLVSEGLLVSAIHNVTAPTMGRTLANLFRKKNNIFWVLVGILLHPLQLAGEALTGRRTALRAVCRKQIS